MLLDLKALTGPREHLERTYPVAAFDATGDFTIGAPVRLSCDVEKIRDCYRLVGGLVTRLCVSCSRCVEPCEMALDVTFDLRYVEQALNIGVGEAEIDDDDLSTAFYCDDQIDLGKLIREQLYLGLPMKILCQRHCRGLCVVCGANLNVAGCKCSVEWRDPRLAALKELLAGKTVKERE